MREKTKPSINQQHADEEQIAGKLTALFRDAQ
jgi:hypothetical protein